MDLHGFPPSSSEQIDLAEVRDFYCHDPKIIANKFYYKRDS